MKGPRREREAPTQKSRGGDSYQKQKMTAQNKMDTAKQRYVVNKISLIKKVYVL